MASGEHDKEFQREFRELLEKRLLLEKQSAFKSTKRSPVKKQKSKPSEPTTPPVVTKWSLKPCSLCHSQFTTIKCLKDHYSVAHLVKMLYNCDKCDKWFPQETMLSEHKSKVHEKVNRVMKMVPQRMIKIQGSECTESFPSVNAINDHRKLAHIKQVEYEFQDPDDVFKTPVRRPRKIARVEESDASSESEAVKRKKGGDGEGVTSVTNESEEEDGDKSVLQCPKMSMPSGPTHDDGDDVEWDLIKSQMDLVPLTPAVQQLNELHGILLELKELESGQAVLSTPSRDFIFSAHEQS